MTAKEFLTNLPDQVQKEAIEGLESCFHFDLKGDGGGQMTVSVADGEVIVEEGLSGTPKCTVKSSADNFVKLCQGQLNPMMAVLSGKVRISNQGEMMKYAKIFGLM